MIGLVLAVAAQAAVDTENFSADWQICVTHDERTGQPAIPETECNERELRTQDARLNQAYKMVMARLPARRRADLRTDERNWIAARDRRCAGPNTEARGECLIGETMKRVAYLERYPR